MQYAPLLPSVLHAQVMWMHVSFQAGNMLFHLKVQRFLLLILQIFQWERSWPVHHRWAVQKERMPCAIRQRPEDAKAKVTNPEFFRKPAHCWKCNLWASGISPSQELSSPLIYQNMCLPFGWDTEQEAIKKTTHHKIIPISSISPHSISDNGHGIDPAFGTS